MSKQREVAVEITGLAPGGDAVGRQRDGEHPGRVVFVPLAAPGEVVRVRLERERPRLAFGELVAVEQPAVQSVRTTPPCPLFTRCGGCQWQHITLEAQQAAKGAIVARALKTPFSPARPTGPPYAYRDRARLTVTENVPGTGGVLDRTPQVAGTGAVLDRMAQVAGTGAVLDRTAQVAGTGGVLERTPQVAGTGGVVDRTPQVAGTGGVGERPGGRGVGFRMRRSHGVVDVVECLLLGRGAAGALAGVRRALGELKAGTQVTMQAGGDGSAAVGWGGRLFTLDGGVLSERPSGDPASWPVIDSPDTLARLALPQLRVPPGGFAQVGAAANAALLVEVARAVTDAPGRVLELFAGSGNFTRVLVRRASAVIASDGDPQAVSRGRINVPEADWWTAADLDGAPLALVDTVVVDPPREGLDPVGLELAARARQRLVYVSCDPQTLARDAERLRVRGFELDGAVALDLMPQTHHVEVVATFRRR